MRNPIPFFRLLVLAILGCNSSEQTNQDKTILYSIEIVDSIQIDYLGSLWINDFSEGTYLAKGAQRNEMLFLDEKGSIKSSFILPEDGPEAIQWVYAMGFSEGQLNLLAEHQGFFSYDLKGNRVWEFRLPFQFYHMNGLNAAPFYKLGSELAYIRPERGEMDWDESWESIFQKIYQEPILEFVDTTTLATRTSMPFPKDSFYQDGNLYGWMFPSITKKADQWILYFRNEMKFWMYETVQNEVVFKRTIELPVNDFIEKEGIPFSREEELYSDEIKEIPSDIRSIFVNQDRFWVIYHKGVPEEIVSKYDYEDREQWRELESDKQFYLGIWDEDFNLIQAEIPLPKGVFFTQVITENGELLALKNQDFFGTEEDFVTYYKLKLIEVRP